MLKNNGIAYHTNETILNDLSSLINNDAIIMEHNQAVKTMVIL